MIIENYSIDNTLGKIQFLKVYSTPAFDLTKHYLRVRIFDLNPESIKNLVSEYSLNDNNFENKDSHTISIPNTHVRIEIMLDFFEDRKNYKLNLEEIAFISES